MISHYKYTASSLKRTSNSLLSISSPLCNDCLLIPHFPKPYLIAYSVTSFQVPTTNVIPKQKTHSGKKYKFFSAFFGILWGLNNTRIKRLETWCWVLSKEHNFDDISSLLSYLVIEFWNNFFHDFYQHLRLKNCLQTVYLTRSTDEKILEFYFTL